MKVCSYLHHLLLLSYLKIRTKIGKFYFSSNSVFLSRDLDNLKNFVFELIFLKSKALEKKEPNLGLFRSSDSKL